MLSSIILGGVYLGIVTDNPTAEFSKIRGRHNSQNHLWSWHNFRWWSFRSPGLGFSRIFFWVATYFIFSTWLAERAGALTIEATSAAANMVDFFPLMRRVVSRHSAECLCWTDYPGISLHGPHSPISKSKRLKRGRPSRRWWKYHLSRSKLTWSASDYENICGAKIHLIILLEIGNRCSFIYIDAAGFPAWFQWLYIGRRWGGYQRVGWNAACWYDVFLFFRNHCVIEHRISVAAEDTVSADDICDRWFTPTLYFRP